MYERLNCPLMYLKEWSEEMFAEIEKILEVNVRPKLADHYGDIKLVSVNDGIVAVKFLGQCKGCLSAKFTIEDVVEVELKKAIPSIKKVILKNDVNEELLAQARKILNESSRAK